MSDLPYDPSYPGPTNPKEFGSGYPTRHGIGIGANIAGNLTGIPGAGMVTGWLAQWITGMFQNGASQAQVQRAVQDYITSGGQSGDTTSRVTAPDDSGTAPAAPAGQTAPPSAGVGIDPMGMPADPGEWWSSDFGRWSGGDQYGTTPGNYVNRAGPGGAFGSRGVWGGQTTIPGGNDQNFMPSLGWAMPAASGGGAYGGNLMAKIAMHGNFKNIATPEQWNYMQSYLGAGQGGGGSGAGVGGAGRPMTQSRQQGDSDVGLKIFKTHQRLQGGTEDVYHRDELFFRPGHTPSSKEASRLYDPGEQSDEDYNAAYEAREADEDDLLAQQLQRRRETAYKTIGVNINGQEVEIPIWDEDMTPEQAEGFARDRLEMGLSPFASDMELEAAQDANAKQRGYAMGTSSVNPGLKLFHAQLKRKKK